MPADAGSGPDAPADAADASAVRRVASRVGQAVGRARRWLRGVERREASELRRWVEDTDNLVHLSALVFVPLLVAAVTALSNATPLFSFLLFPPLASGTYTLFSDPEGRYADPVRFVLGLTGGASCGWVALGVIDLALPGSAAPVSPAAAAFAILLAGAVTWAFDVEEPAAYSAALLSLAAPGRAELYVLFTLIASILVAAVFAAWRSLFYEQRASLLYGTVRGDDHVLVPMRGEHAAATAMFGARLAAAHEAGKVVLLDVVDDEGKASRRNASLAGDDGGHDDRVEDERDGAEHDDPEHDGVERDAGEAPRTDAATAASELEAHAERVRTRAGVPCEVVIAAGEETATLRSVAREANCDLIVTPYEEELGLLSPFVRAVFRGPTDAVAHRSRDGRESWRRVLVLVARAGDSAHAMVDFAGRLAGADGTVSACTCIDSERERRRAEDRLANVVETADRPIETRVARADVLEFLDANADAYDLVLLGSSADRSAASRIVSPPTFRKVRDLECDVAVVDRADVG
ncbi:universal stress protein [Halobaculum sp. EA56]|uniref:universal stress protein n=1 Tax=Halobaculum sp. EA56 TaxID=3421648 RepID=UPI003EB746E9